MNVKYEVGSAVMIGLGLSCVMGLSEKSASEPRVRNCHYVTKGRITARAEREPIGASRGLCTSGVLQGLRPPQLTLKRFHIMRGKFCIETCIKFA